MKSSRETSLVSAACFLVVLGVVLTYLVLIDRFIDWVMK